MRGNSFGKLFTVTTFGESHGEAVGGIIDGCPAGLMIDYELISRDLARRKPGQSHIVTQRQEEDHVELLSGIFEGKTTGTPIGFIIRNNDQRPKDYDQNKNVYRPSHADFTYDQKYGFRDHRGGGRSSARETVCRVVAGAIAKMILAENGIVIGAYTSQVGEIGLRKNYSMQEIGGAENNIVRCPDAVVAERMITEIEQVRKQGDTIGGVISCLVKGVPAGLGEPVFDKLHADLGRAMLSINAVKGFEYGSGFSAAAMKGSQHNDGFITEDAKIRTVTNYSGGIQGGISNGEDICFRVAFKPVATLLQKQDTVDVDGNAVEFQGRGRHDPCVVPRAVPIVEAMAALVITDHLLRNKTTKL